MQGCGHGEGYRYMEGELEWCSLCRVEAQGAEIAALKAERDIWKHRYEDFMIVIGRHADGIMSAIIKAKVVTRGGESRV